MHFYPACRFFQPLSVPPSERFTADCREQIFILVRVMGMDPLLNMKPDDLTPFKTIW